MIKEINATVKHHHKLEAMSIGKFNGIHLGDKGKHIIQSLPHPVPQDKVRQIVCSGVAMDCKKQLSLVIYEEDHQNKSLSPYWKRWFLKTLMIFPFRQ